MTTPNRWAIRDAGVATFWSLDTKKPMVTLRTLKTTGLETTGETVYARGGVGNPKLVGFSGDKEATLSLQDAIFDNKAMAMLTGNNLVEGEVELSRLDDNLQVLDGKVNLSATPIGELLGVYIQNQDGTLGTEILSDDYTLTDKTITSLSFSEGDLISVYYTVNTGSSSKTFKVSSNTFGQTFRVTIDCLVRDEFTKKDFKAQIEVPSAKFEDNFNLNLAADGDPAVLDLNLEVLKSTTSNDMWLMHIYDDSETI